MLLRLARETSQTKCYVAYNVAYNLGEHGLDVIHFSTIYRVLLLAKLILTN